MIPASGSELYAKLCDPDNSAVCRFPKEVSMSMLTEIPPELDLTVRLPRLSLIVLLHVTIPNAKWTQSMC